MAKKVFPIGSLDICLSNRCNLMCKYCYFDSINTGKPLFLTFEQIAKAFDLYIGLVSVNGVDKISFSGAEPFLNYPLLLRSVRYIRSKCAEKPEIELFTNGTFLSPVRVKELQGLQAKIVVSIDGAKQSNDRNRIFHKDPAASVFDCIMGNLRKLSKAQLGRMCASMTVTAQTAPLLAANVRFLREFGFGEVQINLNILEIWGVFKFIFALIFYFAVILIAANTMYMALLERMREFGIMGAIGLKPRRLSRMILLEGFLMSGISGIVGGMVGIMGSFYLKEHHIDLSRFMTQITYAETTLQPRLRSYPTLGSMLIPIVMITVLGMIVATFPARRLRRLRPVDVLREV